MLSQTKIRHSLVVKRAELMERIRRTDTDMRHETTPLSQDFEDQASERENDQVLERINESTRQEVAAIDGALKRLESGTYGICTSCGRTVEATRIAVRPEAETCVACATGRGKQKDD